MRHWLWIIPVLTWLTDDVNRRAKARWGFVLIYTTPNIMSERSNLTFIIICIYTYLTAIMNHHGALFAGTVITANIVWNKPSEVCRNVHYIVIYNRPHCIHLFSYAEIADMRVSVYNSSYTTSLFQPAYTIRLYRVSAIICTLNILRNFRHNFTST